MTEIKVPTIANIKIDPKFEKNNFYFLRYIFTFSMFTALSYSIGGSKMTKNN